MPRIPSLGPRGVGWVLVQGILLALVGATGLLGLTGVTAAAGPVWGGAARLATSAVGLAVMAAGLIQAVRGARDLGTNLTPMPHPRADAALVETGIYARVRHPIYGGLILLGMGWALFAASPLVFLLAALLVPLFWLKSGLEEEWLEERFPGYPAYRRRTRRFIAWIG